jgi:hypothetical protein
MISKLHIPANSWLRLQMPMKLFPALMQQCLALVQRDNKLQNIDELYRESIAQFVNEVLEECVSHYYERTSMKAERTMP